MSRPGDGRFDSQRQTGSIGGTRVRAQLGRAAGSPFPTPTFPGDSKVAVALRPNIMVIAAHRSKLRLHGSRSVLVLNVGALARVTACGERK
jgi:hypothetical protein